MADRIVRCRMTNTTNDRCTGEALDPDGEILICARHAGLVFELVNATRERRLAEHQEEIRANLQAAHAEWLADGAAARGEAAMRLREAEQRWPEIREATANLREARVDIRDARADVRQAREDARVTRETLREARGTLRDIRAALGRAAGDE